MNAALARLDIPILGTQDFLRVADLTADECRALLTLATQLKQMRREKQPHRLLEGQSVAMYFEKPSNRTRVSFEVGIAELGAHPVMLRKDEVNLGVRESIADTARTLSRYVHGIMIRTFAQADVVELAEYATVPVINGLTDDHHPCQILADLQTVQEHFGSCSGRTLVYVGDGNNIAHSLLEGCARVGMNVVIAAPSGYFPKETIVQRAEAVAKENGATVTVTDDVRQAVAGASVVYTDVWASMGQEAEQQQRKGIFQPYQVNASLMALAAPEAIVLHCLPAHRDEEISHEVLETHANTIFEQAENRLHAQKAVMVALMLER